MQASDGTSAEQRREAGRLVDQASDGMGCRAGAAAAVRATGRGGATAAMGGRGWEATAAAGAARRGGAAAAVDATELAPSVL